MRISLIGKNTFFIISLLITCLLIINTFLMNFINYDKTSRVSSGMSILPNVVVHVDLKGSPPKLKYLESLLPILKKHGVNGLLMEYEDMFPYESNLNLAAKHCYSDVDLRHFITKATRLSFNIIPLIQTFGHMEYVLKLEEYKHLRENPFYFDSICPSKPETIGLIKNMLEQVIHFHKNITTLRYVHIGCDEVYHINTCQICREKKLTNLDMFVNHLQSVIGVVKKLTPNTKILIWDDMFRGIKSDLPNTVLTDTEPVYWDYKPQPQISHLDLIKYRRKFKNIWIATAFKGADGRRNILPNTNDRFLNHYSWMTAISNYKFGGESSIYGFNGIILTGWSRYSHMDPPCELLPASIRSLIMNLLVVNLFKTKLNYTNIVELSANVIYKKYIMKEFKKVFHNNPYKITGKDVSIDRSNNLIDLLKTYKEISEEINKGFADRDLFMIEFNTRNYYINRLRAYNDLLWCEEMTNILADIELKIHKVLLHFYETYLVKEYVDYLIYPIKTRLQNATRLLNKYLFTDSWRLRI